MKFLKNNLTSLLAIIAVVASAYCARSNADVTGFYMPFTTHIFSCGSMIKNYKCPKDGYNNDNQILGFHTDKMLAMTMINSYHHRSYYVGTYKSWTLPSEAEIFTTFGIVSGYEEGESLLLYKGISIAGGIGLKMPITDRFGLVINYSPPMVINAGFSWKF